MHFPSYLNNEQAEVHAVMLLASFDQFFDAHLINAISLCEPKT